MNAIERFLELDISALLMGIFIILCAFIAIYEAIGKVSVIIGKPVKWVKKKNEDHELLVNTINELNKIKDKQISNVEMFTEHELGVLDKIDILTNKVEKLINSMEILSIQNKELNNKIDVQQEHLENIDRDGKSRDCSILRDRLLQTTRYFGQNRDSQGRVHINLTEWENINSMFDEYFKAGGNGAVKKIYERDFSKWIIDVEGNPKN